MSEPYWHYVRTEPCEWCAVWIGPHRHRFRADGTLGIILERMPPWLAVRPVQWPSRTTAERSLRVTTDWGSPSDGWGEHIGAALSEGMCPVCLGVLSPSATDPEPEITAGAGECWHDGCPVAPCRWRYYTDGASMWKPLGARPAAYPS